MTSFFLGSLAGVAADLVIFKLFTGAGLAPLVANLISSAVAITITYSLVTRFTFKSRPRWSTYFLFFGWYAISIVTFSFVIQSLATSLPLSPLVAKVVTLPFSFVVNFLASRLILGRARGRDGGARPAVVHEVVRYGRWRFLPLVLAWVALLSAGSLIYFTVRIQSDSVVFEDLSRDLFTYGGDWSRWRLPLAPAYFPDMLAYFAAYFVLPTVKLRIFAVSFLQVVLLGLAVMYLVKQLTVTFRPAAQALGVGILAAITLVCTQTDLWLYFSTTNNHFAALLLPVFATGLIVKYLRRPRLLALVGIVILGVLGQVSTVVYALEFVVPVLLALVSILIASLVFGVGSRVGRRRLVGLILAVVTGAVAALAVAHFVTPSNPIQRFGFHGALVVQSLGALRLVVAYLTGGGGPLVVAMTLLIAACIIYLAVAVVRRIQFTASIEQSQLMARFGVPRVALSSETGGMAFALWLCCWSLPVSVAGSVVTGGLADKHGYRYFEFPLLVLVIITAVRISATVLDRRRWGLPLVGGGMAILLVLVGVSAPGSVAHPRVDPLSTPVAQCLTALRADGVNLTSGVADYWDARGAAFQMSGGPQIEPIAAPSLDPFYWMTTNLPVSDPSKYGRFYDFAVVHKGDGGAPWNVNADTLPKVVGRPTAIYPCSNDTEIWTWNDGKLNQVVSSHFSVWSAG